MTYTLVIGTKNWSTWSLRAWLAMKHAAVPFTEIVVALRRPDSAGIISQYSPSARVPVLNVKDGETGATVFDSLAICEAIAERHPDAGLWPDDPIIRANARSHAAEMHAGFLALREALPMDFARKLPAPPLSDEVTVQVERIQTAWETALSKHASDGDFLFGRFSIADCMFAPVASRFATYDIPMSDAAVAYVARIMALPAIAEWRNGAQQEIDDGLPDQWVVDMDRNAR